MNERAPALVLLLLAALARPGRGAEEANLVRNPDLEDGKVGAAPRGWHAQKEGGGEGRVELTDRQAHSGKLSFHIEHTNDRGSVHPNAPVRLVRGEYVLRFWARTDGDVEFHATVYWAEPKWQSLVTRSFKLAKGQWQRFEVPLAVVEECPGSIQIGLRAAGRMWLDDVELARVVRPGRRSRSTVVWDTGAASAEPLTPEALAKAEGWTKIPAGQKPEAIKGDLVLANDRLAVVVRRDGVGVELYAQGAGAPALRAKLVPLTKEGQPPSGLERVELAENAAGGALARAFWKTAKDAELDAEFRLGRGRPFVEAGAGAGAERLRVEAPGRFAVLPDFFADDVVLDAARLPADRTDVPSDNFLMHFCGRGEAAVLAVSESRERDMELTLAGQGAERRITGSEVAFGKADKGGTGGRIWVGVIEGPGVWHVREVAAEETGKVVGLDWKMPYPAAWRVDFAQPSGLVDCWDMLLEQEDGGYLKPGWLGGSSGAVPANRRRWTTVLGTFQYPCWTDRAGRGFFQPLKSQQLAFQGPALVYPANRVASTPLEALTLVDLVRESLGTGPCEYLLDLEGQKQQYRGMATCSARDALAAIYGAGRQKAKRAEIEKVLTDAAAFLKHIRGRIDGYVQFGHQTREYLAAQLQARPGQEALLKELDGIAAQLDARVAGRRDKIRTPEYAAELLAGFRKELLDYEGADAAERVKKFSQALVEVGSNQDHLVAECRWVIKALRQRAALAAAQDPKAAELAREIRARTRKILRSPAVHEAAHH